MKIEFNKKYTTISVYTIITFSVCLLLLIVILKIPVIFDFFGIVMKKLAPVTWGIVIAFLINPIMKFIERILKKGIERKKPHKKIVRALSVTISMIIFLALLAALISIILPQVIESILNIFSNINVYFNNLEDYIYKFLDDYPDIVSTVSNQFESIQPKLLDFVNNMIPKLGDIAVKLKDGAIEFVIALKDFIIGFIVAVYLLLSKERFLGQARKLTKAFFPANLSNGILRVSANANKTLSGFLSGKIIDSLIIGLICFISMKIMNIEFVTLISVIIGVTNIIPFFGPFIGAIPSGLLLLVAAPHQVIPFVIFIFILQQFDGNILGPMILGDSTGLSAFWVMVAIFLGGGIFGIPGMILGVPIFAVLYELFGELLKYLLMKKNLSYETEDYMTYEEYSPNEKNNKRLNFTFKKHFKKALDKNSVKDSEKK